MALLQLREYVAHQAPDATPIFIAPYLSLDAQMLCREHGVGFLDLEGNARLIFDGVFIERQVASKPVAERRELRSLKVSGTGLFLSDPDALLDEWRDAYEPPAGKRMAFYTTLHGSAFEEAGRYALRSAGSADLAVFACFSAAHWLAPYARTSAQYFYADEIGAERLQSALKLSPTISKGENVTITVLKDSGVFRDTVEPAPGVICTSPVQTYLDLADAGERVREAADYLRREKLKWPN